VYDVPRILGDPHYAARDDIVTVADPEAGALEMPGVIPKFSMTPGAVTHAGPPLGKHNEEIYGRWLGLSARAVEDLRVDGVL